MSRRIEVMAVPVISTKHMPGTFALDDIECVYVMRGEYGGVVSLPFPDDLVSDLPQWLQTVRLWANAQGFDFVRFDADADETEELPTYEEHWE